MRQIFSTLIEPNSESLPISIEDGLQRICSTPNYGFMTTYEQSQNNIDNIKCGVVHVPDIVVTLRMSMVTEKNSPYFGILNYKYVHQVSLLHTLTRISRPLFTLSLCVNANGDKSPFCYIIMLSTIGSLYS